MAQSQTSAFISFTYGGATNGLSIHEREREAARIERERQLQNAESMSLSLPLFPQGPRKVQPAHGDRLQHNIQATLGDFNALAPSMSHQKQYSLLGITNKVPQTPVDAANNKVFNFENNLTNKKESSALDKNPLRNQKMKSQNRTKDEKTKNEMKTNSSKKTVNTEQYLKTLKSTNKKTSDNDHDAKDSQVKKTNVETKASSVNKESSCEFSKQEQQIQPKDKKIINIKKEPKDLTVKHKPPKLSIKTRSPDHTVVTTDANVKKILEEMTQPGPPPLTAIQTPRKNNAPFAFPYNPVASSLLNGSPATHNLVKKEKESEQILKDLHISEDENTDDEANDSSDDSDSSSDSDSDSSSDNSPPNSPGPSKLNEPGKRCKLLNHMNKQEAKKSQPLSETVGSTTSSPVHTGEGDIRGGEVAPGVNTSPLNADNATNGLSIFEELGFELPDISKIFDDINNDGEENGFDPALIEKDIPMCNNDPINHFKPIENPSEIPLRHPEASLPIKEEKKVNIKKEEVSTETTRQLKETPEKLLKSSNKKKSPESSKSNSKINNIKEDSKNKPFEKPHEKKGVKSRKGSSSSKTTKTSVSDCENEEVDVVTVSNDKPSLNKANCTEVKSIKVEESSKVSSKIKSSEKPLNGHKNATVNGVKTSSTNGHNKDTLSRDQKHTADEKILQSLSPKHGLNEEITLDCNSKPDALVVKIPLALLKRIPLLKTIGSKLDSECSPPRKTNKHHLSVECSDVKKPRLDHPVNGESKEGRRHNANSTHNDDYRRKRSPSRDNDRYYNKRRRHDSDSSKHDNEKNVHSKVNGWDGMKDSKLPQENNEDCYCGGKGEAKKRDEWISKPYDPEPRVPHGPDYYLHEAKRVKHRADAIKDHTSKAYKYFESVLNFVNCGKALEQNSDSESRSAYQMYLETIEMLKYAMRLASNRSSQEKKSDKRFIGLCLRLQSLLYMRLFKLRKDSMLKASKTLMDHFKGQPKNTQAPSPYSASNPKTTGTPSPMSPTPSPSGSVGSVGSVGSAGSNEAMTTPSRTSNKPCMTSPVNTCIPQKVHSMTVQHLSYTNYMLYGYDTWEQSQAICNEHRDFFMDLDRSYGPITLQSSIVDIVEYVRHGYLRIQDTGT